ncbi:hypothetical protein GCM10022268_26960 [Sphingomonas cynarae]|uniref:Uncharacterized protein n=1 Tax=Sphingomonas cynarae TaxID=930197 RepID=A0ABP7EE23_9SPHN
MIALFLALQAAAVAAPPATLPATSPLPDALERQSLPERGCAAYLWSVADRKLVAVAGADPARLRLALGGKPADLARVAQMGSGEFGLGGTGDYRLGDITARLEMTVTTRPDLTEGGGVPQGMLTIARGGADQVIVPVAGLIGCAPAR